MSQSKPVHLKSNAGNRLSQRAAGAEKDSDIEFFLVEIIRALARNAAREDHRQVLEAEAMFPSEAKRR
jgi:hypothetical protein